VDINQTGDPNTAMNLRIYILDIADRLRARMEYMKQILQDIQPKNIGNQ